MGTGKVSFDHVVRVGLSLQPHSLRDCEARTRTLPVSQFGSTLRAIGHDLFEFREPLIQFLGFPRWVGGDIGNKAEYPEDQRRSEPFPRASTSRLG